MTDLESLLNPYGGSSIRGIQVFQMGEALLNSLAAVQVLGHTSPGHTLDYTGWTGDLATDVVRDFTAWTSRRTNLAPGCESRLRDLVNDSGWTRLAMNRAADRLGLHSPPAA